MFSSYKTKSTTRVMLLFLLVFCGKGGIRTPGASQLNGFQDRRNRPLCHLSEDKDKASFYICQIILQIF